jgi:HEAT repeat protein
VSKLPPTERFQWRSLLVEMLRALPGPVGNECLLALVQAPGAPAVVVDSCLTTFDAEAPRAKELLLAVLESRYESRDTAERNLAWRALGYLGKPALVDRAWLARGARDPLFRSAALNAIGQLRDPSYLPLLDELLRSGDPQAAVEVTNALTNFLSQEAGELLLVAATRLSGEARDQALTHLGKIREYQDAREQWAVRRSSQQTRAAVVAELVAKLDAKSEEVKIEAIRALATWEAVEAMPRLIELTQSGSKSVAAAARAALERMNAMGEEKKEGKVGG